jgi:hypothetical protein
LSLQVRHVSSRNIALAQSAYFVTTGVAPFISRRFFERVTGRKRDWWLVQTVGALLTGVGGTLGASAARGGIRPEVRLLGATTASTLAAIDIVHVARRRISPVYLADAAVELAFTALWLASSAIEM